MRNPAQKPMITVKLAQEANNESRHNDFIDYKAPEKNAKLLQIMKSADSNELGCLLHTHDNPHLIFDLYANNTKWIRK